MDEFWKVEKDPEKNWDCRAIRKEFLDRMTEDYQPQNQKQSDVRLFPFVELVKEHQELGKPRLALCFRGNDQKSEKVDIYHNTHRMFRFSSQTLYVNHDYFKYCPDSEKERLINSLITKYGFKKVSKGLSRTIDAQLLAKLDDLYGDLIEVFDYYFSSAKRQLEKERQQQLFHFLTEQQNGYFAYDLEFAQRHRRKADRENNEENGESNRTDMLAVKFCMGSPAALAFIEVKSDKTACEGESDVKTHIDSMLKYPKDEEILKARRREARLIMHQYNKLGLITLEKDPGLKKYKDLYKDLSLERVLVFTDTAKEWRKSDKGKEVLSHVKIIEEKEIELPISETEKETIIWMVFDKL